MPNSDAYSDLPKPDVVMRFTAHQVGQLLEAVGSLRLLAIGRQRSACGAVRREMGRVRAKILCRILLCLLALSQFLHKAAYP